MKYFFNLVILIVCLSLSEGTLKNKFKWKQISFKDLPSSVKIPASGQTLTQYDQTAYIAQNVVPLGAVHYKGRLFFGCPRWQHGVPATLAYIDIRSDGDEVSPRLRAYPDWDTNLIAANFNENPNKIVSVLRPAIDACGRLWAVDIGVLNYPNFSRQVQGAAIVIYDLETNRLIRRFKIPTSVIGSNTAGIVSITIDVDRNNCNLAHAYIPDVFNNRLYTYSYDANEIWGFEHNSFRLEPRHADFNINGLEFEWSDGIFSGALTPKNSVGERFLYYHALGAYTEWRVNTKVLKNKLNAARFWHGSDFEYLGKRGKNSQANVHVIEQNTGIALFNQFQTFSVSCWNTKNRFTDRAFHTVHKDTKRLVYPSDITIDDDSVIWVISNKLPFYFFSTLNATDWNFRVYTNSFEDAIEDSNCYRYKPYPCQHHHHDHYERLDSNTDDSESDTDVKTFEEDDEDQANNDLDD